MQEAIPPTPAFIDRSVRSRAEVDAIHAQIRARCHAAANRTGKAQLARLPPIETAALVAKPLSKVLSKLLTPYATQRLGGFEIQQNYTRAKAYAHLRTAITTFDGLTMGIEASIASCVVDIPSFAEGNHQQEAVVYSRSGTLHKAVEYTGPRRLTSNRYVPPSGPVMYLFHAESGTMDPDKYGPNRMLFLDAVRGAVPGLGYDATKQLSFWDVNVDMTGSPTIPAIPDAPPTLDLMLAHTRAQPVQMIIPAVRTWKQRIACRPFANNQVHKGGRPQHAESMVAVAPRACSVQALDADGLYVLRSGRILHLRPDADPVEVACPADMIWREHRAFSAAVFLDHKPIAVGLDGQRYQFWNFMDFRSGRGIGEDWYDREALDASDAEFWAWLTDRFGNP